MTHSVPQRFRRFQNLQPVDRTRVTEVKDRLGNLVYRWANKKALPKIFMYRVTHLDGENLPLNLFRQFWQLLGPIMAT